MDRFWTVRTWINVAAECFTKRRQIVSHNIVNLFHALVERYITRSLYGTNKPDSFAPRSCLLGELAAVEFGVEAVCCEQFVVRAALDNLAVAHH